MMRQRPVTRIAFSLVVWLITNDRGSTEAFQRPMEISFKSRWFAWRPAVQKALKPLASLCQRPKTNDKAPNYNMPFISNQL